MARAPEYRGLRFTIECMAMDDGTCPAGEFLDGLSDSDRTKVDLLFEYLGDQGELRNKEKFKVVEGSDKVFEFKSFQIRILGFFAPGYRFILAHGVRKKRDKLKVSDVKTAERRKDWFFEQLQKENEA